MHVELSRPDRNFRENKAVLAAFTRPGLHACAAGLVTEQALKSNYDEPTATHLYNNK